MSDAPHEPRPEGAAQSDGVWGSLREGTRFFMGEGDVHGAMRELIARLEDARIPYAIAGAMALNAHGHRRFTADVDLLISRESLARFKELNLGRGYVDKFPGSKGMRDTVHGVAIDVLLVGDYPGDGKPKPVAFPEPTDVSVRIEGGVFVTLNALVELKLASGMTAVHRAKDIGDVVELIRAAGLPRELAEQLHPYVREKYLELWDAIAAASDEEY